MTEDSSKARGIIATLLLVLLILLNALLLLNPPVDDFTKAQLNTLNGALLIQLGIMFSYYFGSSSGAKTLSQAAIETNKTLVDKVGTGTGSGNAITAATPTGSQSDPVAVTQVPRVAPEPDPNFIAFQAMVRKMNPAATDTEISRAWANTWTSLAGKTDIPT